MLLPLPVIFLLVLNSSLYYKGIEVYKLYFPNTLVNFLPVGFHSQETLSRDCKVRERKGLFCFLVLVIPPTAATDNCRLHHHLWWLQNSRTNEDLQQTCRACTLCSSRHLIFDNILFSFLLIQQSTFILTHKHTHTHTYTLSLYLYLSLLFWSNITFPTHTFSPFCSSSPFNITITNTLH